MGVSPSAAYHHYKAALLGAVATDGLAATAQSFEQAILDAHASAGSDAKGRALAAFEALGLAYVRFALKNPHRFQVMFGPFGARRRSSRDEPPSLGRVRIFCSARFWTSCAMPGCSCNRASRCASHSLGHPFMRLACLLVAGATKGASADNFKDVVREVSRRTLAGLNA